MATYKESEIMIQRYQMNITKKILIFYTITMICFCVSSFGVYLYDKQYGLIYASLSISIIPILTILTVIYTTIKGDKK